MIFWFHIASPNTCLYLTIRGYGLFSPSIGLHQGNQIKHRIEILVSTPCTHGKSNLCHKSWAPQPSPPLSNHFPPLAHHCKNQVTSCPESKWLHGKWTWHSVQIIWLAHQCGSTYRGSERREWSSRTALAVPMRKEDETRCLNCLTEIEMSRINGTKPIIPTGPIGSYETILS